MPPLFKQGLSAFTLAAWGAIFVYFARSNKITTYLVPEFRRYVEPSGWILLGLAAALMILAIVNRGTDSADSCRPDSGSFGLKNLLGFALLLFPITLSFATPVGFSKQAVENKGILENLSSLPGARERALAKSEAAVATSQSTPAPSETLPTVGDPAPSAAPTKMTMEQLNALDSQESMIPKTKEGYIQAELIDLLFAAQEPTMRPDFEGKTVELIGQFMPEPGANPNGNRYRLMRMWMMCCAADARPIAVSFTAEVKPDVAEMSWVKVIGIAEFELINGKLTPLVKGTKVEASEPPAELMLY